jgi:hypothetical protein
VPLRDLNRYSYAQEKLYIALRDLSTGKGDVRSRLVDAFMAFYTLKENEFPPEFRNDWRWIIKELTKHGPEYDYEGKVRFGSVENTMRKIKNSTAKKIAMKIFDITWELSTNEKYS